MQKNTYSFLKTLASPLRREPVFFVFMYILFVVARIFEQTESPTPAAVYYLENVFDLYLLCALLCILPRRLRPWAKAALYATGYAACISEGFIHERFHLVFVPVTIQLVRETNPDEAGEFFSAYLQGSALWKVVLVYAPIIILNILGEAFSRHVKRFIRRCAPTVGGRLFNVCAPVFVAACFIASIGEKSKMLHFFTFEGTEAAERLDNHAFHTPFYRMVYSAFFLRLTDRELDDMRERMRNIKVDSCSFRVPNIVLYIGESYNKHHSQLYGYSLPTTPRQSAMAREGSLVAFTDVVTPWNVTSDVFKNILSTHSCDQPGKWTDGVLVPAVLKKAGYKTAFITSQYYKTPNMGVTDFNGSFFLNDNELDSLCFDHRNKFRKRYDSNLVKEIDKFRRGDNNFIIFHGIGQHQEYNKRFGPKNVVFTTKDYAHRTDLNENEKQIVADYDNATRFNDYVFAQLCKEFEHDDAVVLYLADHGEEVFDRVHNFGRDHTAELTADIAYSEFEIPFELWLSPKARRLHPDIAEAARRAADMPFASDDLPHVLMGLAGIECAFYDARRDLLSPAFSPGRKRILKHTTDYDSLMSASKQQAEQWK